MEREGRDRHAESRTHIAAGPEAAPQGRQLRPSGDRRRHRAAAARIARDLMSAHKGLTHIMRWIRADPGHSHMMYVGQGFLPASMMYVGQGFLPASMMYVGQGFLPASMVYVG